jgi:hypothetical protein
MHRRPGLLKSSGSTGYSAAMPRSASAHTSDQQNFSSQEGLSSQQNFAALLDRLTQRVHAGSGMQELPDADIPAARTPAFSSAAIRKQSMVPVAKLKPKTDRLADEASELSYENALRLHRRGNVNNIGVPEKDLEENGLDLPANNPAPGRNLPPRSLDPVADAPPTRNSRSKRAAGAAPIAGLAQPPASSVSGAQFAKTARAGESKQGVGRSASRPISKPGTAHGKEAIRAAHAGDSLRLPTDRVASPSSAKAIRRSALRAEKKHTPVRHGWAEATRPHPEQQIPATELSLEIPARQIHLEHRHAVVSLRLSDAEFDRLRVRAAESGISMSAYMRSCVLDAEHLRAQVKETLSQMRASLGGSLGPHTQQQHPAQLASPLPMLTGTQSRPGGAWSRLLWKSATFFLGPLFPYRHRT